MSYINAMASQVSPKYFHARYGVHRLLQQAVNEGLLKGSERPREIEAALDRLISSKKKQQAVMAARRGATPPEE